MSTPMLGVDIARATFTAARWSDGHGARLGTFPNTPEGFTAFAAAVEQAVGAGPCALTLEPTGGYELRLARWAVEQGWPVHRPNPRQVRAWATGIGQRAAGIVLHAHGRPTAKVFPETVRDVLRPIPAPPSRSRSSPT